MDAPPGSLGARARAFPGHPHPGSPQSMGVVLLVEDDHLVANALRLLLVRADYEVHIAADVNEALPTFEAQPVDVVVTDLLMPRG